MSSHPAGCVPGLEDPAGGEQREESEGGDVSPELGWQHPCFSAPNRDNGLTRGRVVKAAKKENVQNWVSPGEPGTLAAASPVVASRCRGLLDTSFFTLRSVTKYLVPGSKPRIS